MNIEALEAIRRARATKLVGKDGAVVEVELEPAVPSAEIERLADGGPPPWARAALRVRAAREEAGAARPSLTPAVAVR
jgi:hypothetical protein